MESYAESVNDTVHQEEDALLNFRDNKHFEEFSEAAQVKCLKTFLKSIKRNVHRQTLQFIGIYTDRNYKLTVN